MTDSTFTIQQNTVNGLVSTLDGKASVDLSNSPYTTNRILEIPQDIKLELSNGTLTLKAGSKVYKTDGSFTPTIISENVTISSAGTTDGTCMVWVAFNVNQLQVVNQTYISSGSGAGSSWRFNTDDNKIYYNGAYYERCLPIAIVTVASNVITSIDQVFNGFGYIGSTVFALPGKYAFADGKEDDGTYNTIIWKNTNVLTYQITTSNYLFRILLDYDNQNLICPAESTFGIGNRRVWDADKNIWILDGVKHHYLEVGSYVANTTSPYNIISFKTSSVDSVANSNASNFSQAGRSYLSGLGAVSSNSEVTSLALGATSTVYTALSTGYVRLRATGGNYLGITVLGVGAYQSVASNTTLHFWSVLLKKGTQYSIEYNGTLTNHTFISAEGEN